MSGIMQGLSASYGRSAIPVPDLTGLISSWGLFNLNPVGYSAALVQLPAGGVVATGSAPYPLTWTDPTITIDSQPPPILLDSWYDQNSNAHDLTQTGTDRPVLNAVDERIDFTAADEQFLANADMGTLGDKITLYLVFSSGGLATAQGLLQLDYSTNFALTPVGDPADNQFAIYQTAAGVLTVAQNSPAVVVSDINSKVKTLAAANTKYLLSVVFDRGVSGAGATRAFLNNSNTGWANGTTANMVGDFGPNLPLAIGTGNPAGTDLYHNGSVWAGIMFNTSHDATELDAWAAYLMQPSIYDIS